MLGPIARTSPVAVHNLAFLILGLFLGLIIGAEKPDMGRKDLPPLTKAGFSTACDGDILAALTSSEASLARQAKQAIFRIPGVKPGSRDMFSGRCYDYMRGE